MSKYQQILDEKRLKAQVSIERASLTLKAKNDGKDGQDLAIENERLKTTLLVLNQKLNSQQDYEEQIQLVKKNYEEVGSELKQYKAEVSSLKAERAAIVTDND